MNRILKTVEVLDSFDGPELILSEDQFGTQHLVYFAGPLENSSELFISTPISSDRLRMLKSGQISVAEVFLKPEEDSYYRIETAANDEEIVAVLETGMRSDLFPPQSYYLDPSDFRLDAISAWKGSFMLNYAVEGGFSRLSSGSVLKICSVLRKASSTDVIRGGQLSGEGGFDRVKEPEQEEEEALVA